MVHSYPTIYEAEEQAKLTQARIALPSQAGVSAKRATAYKAGKKEKQLNSLSPCSYCGMAGHGKMPDSKERKAKCPAWGEMCEYCEKKGHIQSVCKLKSRQSEKASSTNGPTIGTMITSDAPDNLMFCTMTSIPGIQQVPSGKWELDHVEWTREFGWYKTHPKAMPKVLIDIEVMTDEQAILHPKSLFKTKHTNSTVHLILVFR